MSDNPETLQQAILYFADPDRCEAYMRKIRWSDAVPVCPNCGAKGVRIGEIKTRRMLRCKDCRKQFSSRLGTVFESSKIPLDKWFLTVWLVANCKNGVSSYEVARDIDVTQTTAWFMLHRIRAAMEVEGIDKFDGPAEADASYIGGKARNMHKHKREQAIIGRGAVGKAIIHGILQRGETSQVRTAVVKADDAAELVPLVRRHVKYGGNVYTDAARSYGELCFTHFHKAVDHTRAYVIGEIHTNGLEQVFRFNQRVGNDWHRFEQTLRQIGGKRLTYRTLTGKNDAGFMGLT